MWSGVLIQCPSNLCSPFVNQSGIMIRIKKDNWVYIDQSEKYVQIACSFLYKNKNRICIEYALETRDGYFKEIMKSQIVSYFVICQLILWCIGKILTRYFFTFLIFGNKIGKLFIINAVLSYLNIIFGSAFCTFSEFQ